MAPPASTRFATVWFPDWPVIAAGRAGGAPVAVLAANRVVARSSGAAAEGVVIGQRRRQAQRRCPELELVEHDPARDARAFEPIVHAVADLSPRLDLIEQGWIALSTRGPSRVLGGDDALAERLVEVATEACEGAVQVSPGVGVADGRFPSAIAARLAARPTAPTRTLVVVEGGSASFCAPLPIGWLQALGEATPELIDLFARLGLRRLGDLAALDGGDVFGRFGASGVRAHRLAAGDDPRPPSSSDPTPERRLDRRLDDPVEHAAAVVFTAKQLADELAHALAREGRVCTRLVVHLETEHGEVSERCWYRADGMTAAAMVERVRWQLEAWIGGPRGGGEEITAGITLVRLAPDEVRADTGRQLGLWGERTEADERAARSIARLSTIVDERAVCVPVWHGGRLPGERYRWVPALTVDLDQRSRQVSTAGTGSGPTGPWPGSLPAPSPPVVFGTPRPAEVLDATGDPVRVSGRGVLTAAPAVLRPLHGDEASGWSPGRSRPIVAWAGPWLLDERWWEADQHRRQARFQVLVDDGAAYLVVAERQRWWVSATYE